MLNRLKRLVFIALCALLMTNCAVRTTLLKHPETKHVVSCSADPKIHGVLFADMDVQACVKVWQKQGYEPQTDHPR